MTNPDSSCLITSRHILSAGCSAVRFAVLRSSVSFSYTPLSGSLLIFLHLHRLGLQMVSSSDLVSCCELHDHSKQEDDWFFATESSKLLCKYIFTEEQLKNRKSFMHTCIHISRLRYKLFKCKVMYREACTKLPGSYLRPV